MCDINIDELIKNCNRKRQRVKLDYLVDLKKYYLSMYRCYSIMLYDNGYIADPTRINIPMLRKLLLELDIKGLCNNSGRVDLSSDHIMFIYCKNKEYSEKSEFLYMLYNLLKYKEYSLKIDRLYEEYFKEDIQAYINIRMKRKGSMIVQSSGVPFDEALAYSVIDFDNVVEIVDINDTIWVLAMKELNIPESDWYKNGVFDENLTHEEEVVFVEGILNGDFKVSNGLYTDVLVNWLYNHKWNNNNRYKADLKGLFDYIFSTYPSDIYSAISVKMESISDYEDNIITIDKNLIYYKGERQYIDMPFGQFVVMCDIDGEESILPDINIIEGFTGEVYTESRLKEDGINFVGCPIYVNLEKDVYECVYDLEQTDIKCDSWFKSEDMDLSFEDNNMKNPFKKDSIEYQIYQGYINSMIGSEFLISRIYVSDYNDFEKAKKAVMNKII